MRHHYQERGYLLPLALAYLSFATALFGPRSPIDYSTFREGDIVTRDVCIVGGGSGGTYAATRLHQLGKSVIIIEKQAIMGGNTNTYTVPGSGLTIDYGVEVFHNLSIVRDYFAYYNVALASAGFAVPKMSYNVDFRTGNIVEGFVSPNSTAALNTYVQQLNKYPFLAVGLNLPDPVPEDLLIPFNDFVKKYSLADMVQFIYGLDQGYADLLNQPSLYALKSLGLNLVRTSQTGGYIATAAHDNHAIYDAATDLFIKGNGLFLSSYITSVDRQSNPDGSSNIIVETPDGKKWIKAKKIVFAVPPRLSNFRGWDLDSREEEVFSQYRNEAYYTGLITNSGIPDNVTISNIGSDTPYNLPALPAMYRFGPTAEPGLVDIKYGSPFEQDDATVKRNIISELGNLKIPGLALTPSEVEFKAFNAHVPFFEHVTTEQIKNGFYKRANALQGYRGVWYTGAAWETQDSSLIWNFTETILPSIVKD